MKARSNPAEKSPPKSARNLSILPQKQGNLHKLPRYNDHQYRIKTPEQKVVLASLCSFSKYDSSMEVSSAIPHRLVFLLLFIQNAATGSCFWRLMTIKESWSRFWLVYNLSI